LRVGAKIVHVIALDGPPSQGLDEVGIASRDELVGDLDDGDARSERVIQCCELEPDDAAADEEQPRGRAGERQGARGADEGSAEQTALRERFGRRARVN
jgi:hypothetical protein